MTEESMNIYDIFFEFEKDIRWNCSAPDKEDVDDFLEWIQKEKGISLKIEKNKKHD